MRLGGGGGDDGDFLQIERRRPSDFDSAKDEACGSGAAAESQGDDRKMLAEAVQVLAGTEMLQIGGGAAAAELL